MTATTTSVLVLGEVLWDVFPDGPRFGGAPANFACACAELGGQRVAVALASAVGQDALGEQARQQLAGHGVDTAHIRACDRPTGQVIVTLDAAGRASYRFIDDPAWDHVPWTDPLRDTARRADVVCFGTLGQWAATSRETIRSAIRATSPDCVRILDINLRPPFWTRDAIVDSLAMANVLKLNDEELPVVADILGVSGTPEELLRTIQTRYSLRMIALTRGPNGSLLLGPDGVASISPGVCVPVVDTVGAGDAFTAALALGLIAGMPLDAINRWATEAAAFVCTQAGGTPKFPADLCWPAA